MKKNFVSVVATAVFLSILIGGVNVFAKETVSAQGTTTSGFSADVLSEFQNPSDQYKAGARFVIDHYNANNPSYETKLTAQLEDLKAKGYSYIELENHVDYITDQNDFLALLQTVYTVCNRLGIIVDMRVGGTTMGSTTISGDTPLALAQTTAVNLESNTLSNGSKFTGTQVYLSGDTFNQSKLVAALAVTYTTDSNGKKVQTSVTKLDTNDFTFSATAIPGGGVQSRGMLGGCTYTLSHNVTITYNGSNKTFTSNPDEKVDIIIYYQSHGTDGSGTMDYYSTDSAETYTQNVESVLNDNAWLAKHPQYSTSIKQLIQKNGGYFTSDGGDNNQTLSSNTWSSQLISKIKTLYGYDFTNYLAVQYSGYELANGEEAQIGNDWNLAFANLFCDYNQAVKKWTEDNYNSGWRSQVGYSTELDHQVVAQSVSYADTESLFSRNEIDNYLSVVSAARISGQKISNLECAAVWKPYFSTWHELLFSANTAFTTGINRMFYHVVSFNLNDDLSLGWPGYSYNNDSLMDWGVTNPLYEQTDVVNSYVNRVQYLLQKGTNIRDFMIYNDTFDQKYEVDDKVQEAGYTYDIVSPSVLANDSVQTVSNGVIDPNGGSYRAFVVTHLLDNKYMPIDTAETIRKYAQNGVPIVVVGNKDTFIYSLAAENYSSDISADTAQLKEIWNQISATGNLTYVDSEAKLASGLKSVGVSPNVKKDSSSKIYSNCLSFSDGSKYYYIYNTDLYYPVFGYTFFDEYTEAEQKYYFPEYASNKDFGETGGFSDSKAWGTEYVGSNITQTLYLKGTGAPYLFNLWNGEVTPIADYKVMGNGYVAVNVSLTGGDTCVIGFTGKDDVTLHATSLSNDSNIAYDDSGNLVISVTKAGTDSVSLSDGSKYSIDVNKDAVGTASLSGNWNLSVDSRSAAYDNPTNVDELVATAHETLTANLNDLTSWDKITFTKADGSTVAGTKVCGVGTYTTAFTMNGNYDGAYLSLGKVFDTVKVYVNGEEVAINQQNMTVDIADYVVSGQNTLKLETTTNFNNLKNANKIGGTTMFGDPITEQNYGLLGPVTITPYVNVKLTNN
ncbi:MAG: hypothetical protein H6Q69_90 [Firmicutes bacterium]|nr:hypothetical protein [Bacillota bacterium]